MHVILGSGEYAQIKIDSKPLFGRDRDSVAEKTKLGWFVLLPGQEFNQNRMMLTQTSQTDYEELCHLDVLGLADSSEHDQLAVYSEFKGPLKYLVAKLHGCYPGANSLPVSQNFFARFFRRRPVADSSRCLTFLLRCNKHKKTLFAYMFFD